MNDTKLSGSDQTHCTFTVFEVMSYSLIQNMSISGQAFIVKTWILVSGSTFAALPFVNITCTNLS